MDTGNVRSLRATFTPGMTVRYLGDNSVERENAWRAYRGFPPVGREHELSPDVVERMSDRGQRIRIG